MNYNYLFQEYKKQFKTKDLNKMMLKAIVRVMHKQTPADIAENLEYAISNYKHTKIGGYLSDAVIYGFAGGYISLDLLYEYEDNLYNY